MSNRTPDPNIERREIDTQEGYDLWAPSYDATDNPVVAIDEHVLAEVLASADGRLGGQLVVDAGCGTGRHIGRLADSAQSVLGLDFSAGMLAQARSRWSHLPQVSFRQQDLSVTPFAHLNDSTSDGILCSLVGEHITDLVALFVEFRRILKPGGRLVFSVYHPQLALQGKAANFRASATGDQASVEYRLGATAHLVSDYVNAMRDAGFTLGLLREVLVTPPLCEAIPAAATLAGNPALLVFTGD
ncbi:MAG: hypothetical protein Tsb0020_09930 [Haliangiales bacterium]